MAAVIVRHNFETGHRLPMLEGKCQSLHGHSWWAEIVVSGQLDADGVLVEFGALKAAVRGWIDEHLDHGLMLGARDPLLPVLADAGKVFVFTEHYGAWPTVENVARLIHDQTQRLLATVLEVHHPVETRVVVQETHVNAAAWPTA